MKKKVANVSGIEKPKIPKFPINTENFVWEWESDNGWSAFDDFCNTTLETDFKAGKSTTTLHIGSFSYTVNFSKFIQTNNSNLKKRSIRRTVLDVERDRATEDISKISKPVQATKAVSNLLLDPFPFSDVTVIIGDNSSHKLHKFLLAKCKQLNLSSTSSEQQSNIYLPWLSPQDFSLIQGYLYSGCLEKIVTADNFFDLYLCCLRLGLHSELQVIANAGLHFLKVDPTFFEMLIELESCLRNMTGRRFEMDYLKSKFFNFFKLKARGDSDCIKGSLGEGTSGVDVFISSKELYERWLKLDQDLKVELLTFSPVNNIRDEKITGGRDIYDRHFLSWKDFPDVTFRSTIDGQEFSCHRALFYLYSPEFAKKLKTPVHPLDFDGDTIEEFLNLLYSPSKAGNTEKRNKNKEKVKGKDQKKFENEECAQQNQLFSPKLLQFLKENGLEDMLTHVLDIFDKGKKHGRGNLENASWTLTVSLKCPLVSVLDVTKLIVNHKSTAYGVILGSQGWKEGLHCWRIEFVKLHSWIFCGVTNVALSDHTALTLYISDGSYGFITSGAGYESINGTTQAHNKVDWKTGHKVDVMLDIDNRSIFFHNLTTGVKLSHSGVLAKGATYWPAWNTYYTGDSFKVTPIDVTEYGIGP